jgi:hypothetical protein
MKRDYAFAPVRPMTITIELPPHVEASLAAMAAEQGMALPDYLRHLLEEQVPPGGAVPLSPADRARVWRDSAKDMPHTPPLSDEAVSRESFYDTSGYMAREAGYAAGAFGSNPVLTQTGST